MLWSKALNNHRYGDYTKEPEEPTVGAPFYPPKAYGELDSELALIV